jgi:hypothetical protein
MARPDTSTLIALASTRSPPPPAARAPITALLLDNVLLYRIQLIT